MILRRFEACDRDDSRRFRRRAGAQLPTDITYAVVDEVELLWRRNALVEANAALVLRNADDSIRPSGRDAFGDTVQGRFCSAEAFGNRPSVGCEDDRQTDLDA